MIDLDQEWLLIYWPEKPYQLRMLYALVKGGISTVPDAESRSDWEIIQIPRCGPKTVALLRKVVSKATKQTRIRKSLKRGFMEQDLKDTLREIWPQLEGVAPWSE